MTVDTDTQSSLVSFQRQLLDAMSVENQPARRGMPLLHWFGLAGRPSDPRTAFDRWCRTHYVVDEQHKVIYCPIEKNACTYFREKMLVSSQHAEEFQSSGMNPHSFIRKRKRMLLRDPLLLRDSNYFRFVIVRDPIERLVSAYVNKFVVNRLANVAVQAARQYAQLDPFFDKPRKLITFRMFLRLLETHDDPHLDNHWRSQISFVAPVIDQFDWLVPMNRIVDFLPILEERLQTKLSREKSANKNDYQSHDLSEQLYDKFPAALRKLEQMPGVESLVLPEFREVLQKRFAFDFDFHDLAQHHFDARISQHSR